LKDVKSAIKAAGQAQRVDPDLESLKRLWKRLSAR